MNFDFYTFFCIFILGNKKTTKTNNDEYEQFR